MRTGAGKNDWSHIWVLTIFDKLAVEHLPPVVLSAIEKYTQDHLAANAPESVAHKNRKAYCDAFFKHCKDAD